MKFRHAIGLIRVGAAGASRAVEAVDSGALVHAADDLHTQVHLNHVCWAPWGDPPPTQRTPIYAYNVYYVK